MNELDISSFCYSHGEAADGSGVVATLLDLTYANESSLLVSFLDDQLAEFVEPLTDAIEQATHADTTGPASVWPLSAVRRPRVSGAPTELMHGLRLSGMRTAVYGQSILITFVHPDGDESFALVTLQAAHMLVNHARHHQAFPPEPAN